MCSSVQMEQSSAKYLRTALTILRTHPEFLRGPSLNASKAVEIAAKAYAILSHRHFVLPRDIEAIACIALAHSLIPVTQPNEWNISNFPSLSRTVEDCFSKCITQPK